jgi:hypothetical protein
MQVSVAKSEKVAGEMYRISGDIRYVANQRAMFEAVLVREYGDPVAEIFDRQQAGFERCFEALGIADDRERSWSSLVLAINESLGARWETGTPPTENNDYDFYIVAVRRAHDPENVWVFPAAYANNYDGELQDQDGIEFIANGWFDVGPHRYADPMFVPTLEKGDEVVGWQQLPKYCA